jgi:transposase
MPGEKRQDKKKKALLEQSCLNPRAEQVTDNLFREEGFFDPRDLVQVKYEMLRSVGVDKRPVTEAAQSFGFSRPSFYKAKKALDREGLIGLTPKKRGPRTRHKLSGEVLSFVKGVFAKEGRLPVAELADRIKKRFGLSIHPRSIERALNGKKKMAEGLSADAKP